MFSSVVHFVAGVSRDTNHTQSSCNNSCRPQITIVIYCFHTACRRRARSINLSLNLIVSPVRPAYQKKTKTKVKSVKSTTRQRCVWKCVCGTPLDLTCFHSYLLPTHKFIDFIVCLLPMFFLMGAFHAFIRLIDKNICQNILRSSNLKWSVVMTLRVRDRIDPKAHHLQMSYIERKKVNDHAPTFQHFPFLFPFPFPFYCSLLLFFWPSCVTRAQSQNVIEKQLQI